MTVLEVSGLTAGYGAGWVVRGVELSVRSSEVYALIGPNGSGKSTVLRSLFGLLPSWEGRISFLGRPGGLSPREMKLLGASFLPQWHGVFRRLSVDDNLEVAGCTLRRGRERREAIAETLGMFPELRTRLPQVAGTLSGGERQLLALACCMVSRPRLLLLDEPSLGLSPELVDRFFERLKTVCDRADVAALVAEQKIRQVLRISRRVLVLRQGDVAFSGLVEDLDDEDVLWKYMW